MSKTELKSLSFDRINILIVNDRTLLFQSFLTSILHKFSEEVNIHTTSTLEDYEAYNYVFVLCDQVYTLNKSINVDTSRQRIFVILDQNDKPFSEFSSDIKVHTLQIINMICWKELITRGKNNLSDQVKHYLQHEGKSILQAHDMKETDALEQLAQTGYHEFFRDFAQSYAKSIRKSMLKANRTYHLTHLKITCETRFDELQQMIEQLSSTEAELCMQNILQQCQTIIQGHDKIQIMKCSDFIMYFKFLNQARSWAQKNAQPLCVDDLIQEACEYLQSAKYKHPTAQELMEIVELLKESPESINQYLTNRG